MSDEPPTNQEVSVGQDYIQPNLNYALRIWWAYYWPTSLISGVLIVLTNVHRHSGSKTVDVRIGADAQHVWLEVEDQGKGGAGGTVRAGIGITGMRERVANLAGELRIDSSQNGTSASRSSQIG